MNTLRDVLGGLYPSKPGEKPNVFSKPDRISDVLDLRRMSASAKVTGNAADFYELYWAHRMQGTTWNHVLDWFAVLLFRGPGSVPGRLQILYWLCWGAFAIVFLMCAYLSLFLPNVTPSTVAGGAGAGLLLWPLVRSGLSSAGRKYGLNYLGDAARYLRAAPENIGIRQTIRTAGLEVLRRLHDEPMQRYDRIVVVGHSLGSVIAYDILTHLWQEMHWQHSKPMSPKQPIYEEMKRCLEESRGEVGEVEQYRVMQNKLLNEEQGLGMPWKVSDLITIGSPLTYADYLLVDRRYPLERKRQDRELPTCPPQLEDDRDIGFLSPTYGTKDDIVEKKRLLHHAALFACTRWTNIYFKSDIIGGALIPVLGTGIKDISLTGDTDAGKRLSAHVMYWDSREKAACAALKDAMCLSEVKEISHG